MRLFLFSYVDSDLVLGQRTDQLVVGGEQRALRHVQSLAQSHQRPVAEGIIGKSLGTGFVDERSPVTAGQRDHALHQLVGQHVPYLQSSLRPAMRIWTNDSGSPQQMIFGSIVSVAFALWKMAGFGLESARLALGMQPHLLLSKEDPYDAIIPVHTDFTTEQMTGHRVEGPVDFDVSVHRDPSTAHPEETEGGIGQRTKTLALLQKVRPNLSFGGAVDVLPGDPFIPVYQCRR